VEYVPNVARVLERRPRVIVRASPNSGSSQHRSPRRRIPPDHDCRVAHVEVARVKAAL